MNYQETIDWLFAQLPMYQRVGGANYKIDLEKTHALMDLLHHPENKFKSIHVAGTNGKGSVSHMCASALQEKGLKVGLYTSPHLKDFRERIKINGEMISEEAVIRFVEKYKSTFVKLELSFFEMTVGMAFDYFASQKVDIAVVEVGMGGRLDSTNVITPLVSVITNIGLDHTQFLGNWLAKIAAEKAGIIKGKVPVVVGRKHAETTSVFEESARYKRAALLFAEEQKRPNITSDLQGIYQKENKQTAYYALQLLPEALRPTLTELKKGFENVVKNTGLLGRWQTLSESPLTICDTGHNEDGLKMVLEQISQSPHKNLQMVWGMVNDKDVSVVLKMLPKNATYYFTKPSIPRGLGEDVLYEEAQKQSLIGKKYATVNEALKEAQLNAASEDLIFVGGSTFVVAEVV